MDRHMKKFIKRAILVLLVLLLIAGVIIYLNINRIIKTEVQTQGSSALGVETTLGDADLSLFGGSLSLDQLQVGSPKGFAAAYVMRLEKASVAIHYGQLMDNPIHISSVTLDHPTIVVEQVSGQLNVKALGDQASSSSNAPPSAESSSSPPMKLIIDTLEIDSAVVVLHPGIAGMKQEIRIPIPSMTLHNIGNAGGKQEGAGIQDVIMAVINGLVAQAQNAKDLPGSVGKALGSGVNSLSNDIKNLFGHHN